MTKEGVTVAGSARRYAVLELGLVARTRGTDHLDYGNTLVDLAMIELAAHRCRDAEPRFAEGIRILETAAGSDSTTLVAPMQGQAECLLEQRRFAEALPIIERNLAIAGKAELPG